MVVCIKMTTITCFTFITALFVGVITLSFANNCKVHYVKPEDHSQTECPKQPNYNCTCLTLNEYAREAEKFFPNGSNTTLLFLAGNHFLNTTLTINSTTSQFLREHVSQALVQTVGSRIYCNNLNRILFNVHSASIAGLHFYSCYHTYKGKTNVDINNCTFNESYVAIIGNERVWPAVLTLAGDIDFASSGTSIYFRYVNLLILGNVTFSNNDDSDSGMISGIYCALEVQSDAVVTFNGRGSHSGSGIDLQYCNVTISGHVQFHNIIADYGGGISVVCSPYEPCTFIVEGNIYFLNNSARHHGGGMYLKYGNVQLKGKVFFENNLANESGGAMYLHSSFLYFWTFALLTISNNHAGRFGGAIYIFDTNPYSYCPADALMHTEDCFFQVVDRNVSQQLDVQIVSENNTAELGGDMLYGGAVDHCEMEGNEKSGVIFNKLANITEDATLIASEPFRVCHCTENRPQCGNFIIPIFERVLPGQTLTISVVTVGQRNGSAPSVIQGYLSDMTGQVLLANSEVYQHSNRGCSNLSYTMFSSKVKAFLLILSVINPCSLITAPVHIAYDVTFLPCPTGFTLSNDTGGCTCEERLQKYTNECDINDKTIFRPRFGKFWVGYSSTSGLILSPHCPFDYCISSPVRFRLNETYMQCNYRRTGMLCGACQDGFSLVLGSSQCKKCSNAYLSLLGLFAFAGLVLVVLLLACKLTVAVGTISGLIFYANIIAFNKAIFLPNGTNSFLAVFLSWVNLDLGIEVCVTKLEYPSELHTVWLYDANIKFFHGKHIALVVLALIIFFFFFLPYTLLLLLGHWLQTKSHL